jgi:large subunit ribosomal protein L15
MPLYQRVPKKGFQNRFRVVNEIVNVGDLAAFGDNATVDAQALAAKGLIRGSGTPVKVLGEGDAPKGLTLKVNKISASAQSKIEAAGGSVEIVGASK